MGNYTFRDMAIGAIVILGIIAIVYVAAQAMGVPIPMWVWHILGIVLVVFVCVFAIKLITGGGNPPP